MRHFSNIIDVSVGACRGRLKLIRNLHQIFQFMTVTDKAEFEALETQKFFFLVGFG
jgi:hypothetical protein